MTTAGKNESWSIIIIVRKICSVSKKVSDTKMYKIDNCGKKWRATEMRGLIEGSVPLEQWGTLLVSGRRRFVSRRCFWYTRRWASFEFDCSISWDEMNMFWIDVSFDSSRVVSHWLLEHRCIVLLCTRASVIRDRDNVKICRAIRNV